MIDPVTRNEFNMLRDDVKDVKATVNGISNDVRSLLLDRAGSEGAHKTADRGRTARYSFATFVAALASSSWWIPSLFHHPK